MNPRKRLDKPSLMLIIGCVTLAIANSVGFLLRRSHAFPESVADPLSGFLLGLPIGILLLALVLRTRQQKGRCASV